MHYRHENKQNNRITHGVNILHTLIFIINANVYYQFVVSIHATYNIKFCPNPILTKIKIDIATCVVPQCGPTHSQLLLSCSVQLMYFMLQNWIFKSK